MNGDIMFVCGFYRIAQAMAERIDFTFAPYLSVRLSLTVKRLSEVLNFSLRPTDRGIHSIRLHLIRLNSVRFN